MHSHLWRDSLLENAQLEDQVGHGRKTLRRMITEIISVGPTLCWSASSVEPSGCSVGGWP